MDTQSAEKIELIKDDPRYFGLIYQKYIKEIYAYCYYLSGNKHKAEDLASSTFLRALEKFNTFSGEANQLRAWLYRIARNIFIDETRKKQNNDQINLHIDIEIAEESNLSDDQHTKLMLEEITRCIEKLEPPIYCEILMLRYKQELEIAEISEIVGKNEQNVRTLLHRAMLKLREEYLGNGLEKRGEP